MSGYIPGSGGGGVPGQVLSRTVLSAETGVLAANAWHTISDLTHTIETGDEDLLLATGLWWNASGGVQNMAVAYSTDGGSTLEPFLIRTIGNGFWDWIIGMMRIPFTTGSQTIDIYVQSSNTFTVRSNVAFGVGTAVTYDTYSEMYRL